jgi:hypothetical protein
VDNNEGTPPGSGEPSWHLEDLDAMWSSLEDEFRRPLDVHRGLLNELTDTQARRGRTGVAAATDAHRRSRETISTPSLHCLMEIALLEAGIDAGDGRNDARPH